MAAPTIILVVAMTVYPLIYSLRLAFHQWDLQNVGHPFVGLDNFRAALGDSRVWNALRNTMIIVVFGIALEFLLGFGLALLVIDTVHLKRFVVPFFMLPVMMVPVVVGLTWRMLWDNQYGAINQMLRTLIDHDVGFTLFGTHVQLMNHHPVNIVWLGHADTALFAMIVTQVWQWTPFMFFVLLAGLSAVNPELYEAASLDGANWWHSLRDITLPGMSKVIAVAVLFRALDAFKIFDLVYMFTQGGPGTSTESVSWYIYQVGFKFFRMGYASAISYLMLIFLSVAATLYVSRFLTQERT